MVQGRQPDTGGPQISLLNDAFLLGRFRMCFSVFFGHELTINAATINDLPVIRLIGHLQFLSIEEPSA
jgi:hypothetical protein